MSVSKKVLSEAHLALLENGEIALVDTTKTGALRVHRVISREECINLLKVLFVQFRHDNPDIKVMQIPFSDNEILALTTLQINK